MKTTPAGFKPTLGDPIGLAGRRLNQSATGTRGQCHIGKWDSGTIGAWDNRQWDNGPMSHETMDIGTVDTEQLADACVSVWQT